MTEEGETISSPGRKIVMEPLDPEMLDMRISRAKAILQRDLSDSVRQMWMSELGDLEALRKLVR